MVSFRHAMVLISLFCLPAAYGNNIRYIAYGNEQGLPSNLTKAIIQDAAGFIWVGSDAGLARFDGKNFATFTELLPNHYVKQLFIDRAQTLLVVTDGGITAVHGTGITPHFSPLLAATPQHTDTTLFYPKGLFEARDGALWISEPDAVVKYAKGALRRYHFDEKYRADSYSRSFQCLEDKEGGLFVLSERGYVFRYNMRDDRFDLLANEQGMKPFIIDAAMLSSSGTVVIGGSKGIYELQTHPATKSFSLRQLSSLPKVSSLIGAKDGSFFAGTWLSGLYRLEGGSRKWTEIPVMLPFKVINALATGRQGEIWVSSDEGIALVSETYFTEVPLPLANYYIEAIAHGPDGTIVATDGDAVVQIEHRNDAVKIKKIFTKTESLILSLATDGATVWIGYRDGFITRLKNGSVTKLVMPSGGNRLVDFLFCDRKKNLWICQDGVDGVYKLSPDLQFTYYGASKGLASHTSVLRESAGGTIWCGGTGASSYLFRYDARTDSFVNKSRPLSAAADVVSTDDLAIDGEDHVWLGTSNGLLQYRNGTVVSPPGFELFKHEPIKSTALDSMGNLWLGTDRSVLRYTDGQVSRFDGRDGLTSMTMAYRACIIDRAGKVWLGTAHGISRWNLAGNTTGLTPAPLFMSIDMNGTAVADESPGSTDYEYNSYFSALAASLTYPAEKILYRYRVNGQPAAWSMPTYSPAVVVPQCREGRYTVEISAQQVGYLWSTPSRFSFAVAPPFYRTWWAYGLYAIFLGIGLATVAKIHLERLERKKLQSALLESENNLRALFNTMNDIYFQSDLSGKIMEVAPSIVIHSGYTREELIGADSGLMYAEPRDRKRLVMKLAREGEIIDHEILLKKKKGKPVWVSMNAQLVKDETGNVIGTRGVMREITTRKKLEDDLRNNLKRERDLNELKSRFVSMVSHEFRTPLASILSSTELLERYGKKWDEQKAEKARTHYLRITDAIKRMVQLLDDVLIIGKAEAGKLEFVPKMLPLTEFCRRIVEEMQATIDPQRGGISFEPAIAADEAMFDEKLLRHLITNILSNAVKYSPEGGVVTFALSEEDDHAVFTIRDRGIGIPKDDLAHLFESFHRSKNVGNIPGTGLGLTIVKQCVDLHGGTISVASAEGEGTTFTIALPLKRSASS